MLVLSRLTNESVYIEVGGVQVRIELARCEAGKARLAIDAPANVLVHRGDNRGQMLAMLKQRGITPA